MTEFLNRRVVVIGGSRGIGYAVSRMLVARGACIAIGARDTTVLTRVRDELSYEGAMPFVGGCDIADTLSTGAFIDTAAARLGGIDALINCASGFTRADDDAAWHEAMNVDLMGVVRAVRAAGRFCGAAASCPPRFRACPSGDPAIPFSTSAVPTA